ncbi:hypothetical protein CHUAL_002687 [Chamberlinius hualienensis]
MPIAEVPNKCICQICTCGRHRCPHRPGTTLHHGSIGDKVSSNTEYNERYAENGNVPKREALRRAKDNIALPTERLENATTSRSDYMGHKGEKSTSFRNIDQLRYEGDLDHNTSYHNDYEAKQSDRGRPVRGKDNLGASSAKFDAQPSYRDHYQTWSTTRQPMNKRNGELELPNGPMDLSTTTQLDYKENKVERNRMTRPITATKISGDFDGATTNRDVYKGLAGGRQKNFKPNSQYEPSEHPFDGYTTHRSDFTEKQVARPRKNRPLTSTRIPDEEFAKSTTSSQHYQPWQTQKREIRRPQSYMKSEGEMDLMTITKNDYGGDLKGEKAKLLRPGTTNKHEGDFYDGTTHKNDYQGWKGSRPQGAQQLQTTSQLFDSTMPLDGTTSYRSTYIGHAMGGPCPAVGLKGDMVGNQNYSFKTLLGGHHFYSAATPVN